MRSGTTMTKNWEDAAQLKRTSVTNSIPSKWVNETIKDDMIKAGFSNTKAYLDSILPEDEVAITELTVLELQAKIASGELMAANVANAYCHRAALAHQILNCCSEIFFDKALETAKKLDEYFAKTGTVAGKLHGIPISLKDQVDLPGLDSSIGYVALLNKPKTEMSLLAEYLQKEGAVFYVKTTVPMAMLAPQTDSNIFGYSYNALNLQLSTGGSSGGEGALIGAGASPLGFGTDIGGSIRIPSAFQGLYGLRPTSNRISYLRVSNSYSGQTSMPSVIGPMARSLADIEYITKLIFNGKLWKSDPKVAPVPFSDNSSIKLEKLTYGLWKFDGMVRPHPPIQRALEETAKCLRAQGHEIVDIQLPNVDKIYETTMDIFTADKGREVLEMCKESGEPVVPAVKTFVCSKPGESPIDVNEWWDLCNRQYECQVEFYKFWEETASVTESGRPIDAIICPVWPFSAFFPGNHDSLNYSCPFNLLDCASVVVPVNKVDEKLDPFDPKYVPLNGSDEDVYKAYKPELFDGMPVCIQVVGKKFEDEKVLAAATAVDYACRKS